MSFIQVFKIFGLFNKFKSFAKLKQIYQHVLDLKLEEFLGDNSQNRP